MVTRHRWCMRWLFLVAWALAALVIVCAAVAREAPVVVSDDAHAHAPLVEEATTSSSRYLRVIVIGATGDLAAKYLWVACFRLALEAHLLRQERVQITAAAREPAAEGEQWKNQFFSPEWVHHVCGDDDNSTTSDNNDTAAAQVCRAFYENEFVANIEYATLQTPEDYAALSATLLQKEGVEIGRLVYLSIPPHVFLEASQYSSQFLRPASASAFFRVVIEKPFGRDLSSALVLAAELRNVLHDDEILLMDHYAGKAGVRVIDTFLRENAASLARVWNGDHIHTIAIAMSETEMCEHRLEYFDRNGIIRDVIANHLQLVLGIVIAPSLKHFLSTSSFSGGGGDRGPLLDELCPHELTLFLRSLRRRGGLTIGQYDGYSHNKHHQPDATPSTHSFTATAAAVELASGLPSWAHTRLLLSAAKATDKRKAEVVVHLKMDPTVHDHGKPCSLRFVLQDGAMSSGERIDIHCASLGEMIVPPLWTRVRSGSGSSFVLQLKRDRSFAWQLGDPISAYDTLVRDAVHGQTSRFMKLDEVLASWALWSPIVLAAEQKEREAIVIYPVGATTWWRNGSHLHQRWSPRDYTFMEDNICLVATTPTQPVP